MLVPQHRKFLSDTKYLLWVFRFNFSYSQVFCEMTTFMSYFAISS